MKFSTVIVGAFAALASAAPTEKVEKRVAIDLGAFNSFNFANQDLQYLLAINQFDFNALAQLASFNNLNLGGFQTLFTNDVFDINALLQLQQLALLSQLGGLGVFGQFDLSTLGLNVFDQGLIGNIGGFGLNGLVDQSLIPQIQTVIQQTEITQVVIKK
ncbi:hypothetical protein F4778DRAFT_783342 [Xylariomycetidae sp. FL2044]|nr:hypothetical protein F4778DRAFT_783342 [Xylariomycetidae sp. FL2044]